MIKRKLLGATALALCGVFGFSTLAACAPKEETNGPKKDSIVIMTEELSGLFNPFYATSGTDMDVVGMTQIGMLTTDENGATACGEDEPTVVLDYKIENVNGNNQYTFVIKNNLKFSDGVPLTMNDVMFNIYEYLDPVYTGSSTLYSIDIQGLGRYRTQQNLSDEDGMSEIESENAALAADYADLRIMELYLLYTENFNLGSGTNDFYLATQEQMEEAIENYTSFTSGYKMAVATAEEQARWTNADYQKQLMEDYHYVLETFREELESDLIAAKESFDITTPPYSEHKDKLESDVFRFLLYEGRITPVYAEDPANPGRDDLTKIERFDGEELVANYPTVEDAIEGFYESTIESGLDDILTVRGTAGTIATQYAADALSIILHGSTSAGEGELAYPNISGVVSLGHTTDVANVVVNDTTYKVAHQHNADGTPVNADEYDVLQITINGVDPKAIYNFGFTVAPAHYYTADAEHPNGREIDIVNNKFGVEWADSDFQSKTIQSQLHQEVPVGAGAYQATDRDNNTSPSGSAFWSSNIVYFKANENFMFDVKTEKLRMQVVTSTDAISNLASGAVDYIVPQYTVDNYNQLSQMENAGNAKTMTSWQLGYGYIGINAGKVPDVNIRRAIMAAMQTNLASQYYQSGTCTTLDWPMSKVSWAYPYSSKSTTGDPILTSVSKPNGRDYTQWTTREAAEKKIKEYMAAAHNGAGAQGSDLSITFTIAGSSISEHPCYRVFVQAQELLNSLGWDIELKADSQALTKLATGSLEVWAAAWGSTIDPDMYQVYHMNSTASSTYAWGYREIKADTSTYSYEYGVIQELSEIIDDAREIDDQDERTELYEEAMRKVLDIAVELPVYQRKNLYAYNPKTVKGFTTDVNPYTSPLEKIWELELIG